MDKKSAPILRITEAESRRDHTAFIDFPYQLYRDDPFWVPPLRGEESRRWDPALNASLAQRPHWRFLAWRGPIVVGRICASLDSAFAERWRPGAGLFGFFECRDDVEAARALLAAAEQRLASKGVREVIGPVNLTLQDEVGLLTSGFMGRPRLLSPYNPPWYPTLLEQAGYTPLRRYLAYLWNAQLPENPTWGRIVRQLPAWADRLGITLNVPSSKSWNRELQRMHSLYNQSFDQVWGYTPITWEEFRARAERFRPFYQPELVVFAERGAELLGFGLALPDVNEVLHLLHGRLWPFGWLRFLARRRRIRSARFILLAIRPDLQGSGLGLVITGQLLRNALALGFRDAELSLVDEDNMDIRRMIEANGCQATKRYTLFAKPLPGADPA